MARQISVTVTCGRGSEKHNHDLKYREALDHTHTADCPNAIIELVPYQNYKDKINELMKPYIDDYNEKQQARYKAAWDRYNAGIIKTKPRKSNYKPMSYDYYEAHKDDVQYNRAKKIVEPAQMWRSLILGLGDQEDRQEERITEFEAVSVMRAIANEWNTMFPDFKLLGASLHLDEQGFYHAHFDYMPLFENDKEVKQEQGLRVSNSQEAALEHMGYEPEQSIINGRDKVPIRFNAFRNRLYREIEKELAEHKIHLQYGVSSVKEPDKDSGVNQNLKAWQDTRDGVIELQSMKNTIYDIVNKDELTEDECKEATTKVFSFKKLLEDLCSKKYFRIKGNVMVPFSLFDQLKSLAAEFLESIAAQFNKIRELTRKVDEERARADHLKRENDELKVENQSLNRKVEELEAADPSEDFIQEHARRSILERYDALLDRNIGRQDLINREISSALYSIEKEYDGIPYKRQVIEKEEDITF